MNHPFTSAYYTVVFRYLGHLDNKLYRKIKGLPYGWTRRHYASGRWGMVRFSYSVPPVKPGYAVATPDVSWLSDYTLKLMLILKQE